MLSQASAWLCVCQFRTMFKNIPCLEVNIRSHIGDAMLAWPHKWVACGINTQESFAKSESLRTTNNVPMHLAFRHILVHKKTIFDLHPANIKDSYPLELESSLESFICDSISKHVYPVSMVSSTYPLIMSSRLFLTVRLKRVKLLLWVLFWGPPWGAESATNASRHRNPVTHEVVSTA